MGDSEEILSLAGLADWLSARVRSPQPSVRSSWLQRDARLLEALEAMGVVRGAGLLSQTVCDHCERGFVARVYQRDDGRWAHSCLCAGEALLAQDDVKLVAIDRAALIGALANGAGSAPHQVSYRSNNRLATLSTLRSDDIGAPCIILYADGLEDAATLELVINTIERELARGPGLVATPSGVAMSIPLPKKYQLIRLEELFEIRAWRLEIRHAEVAARCGAKQARRLNPGRPGRAHVVERLWRELRTGPDWPSTYTAQARRIIADWPPDEGEPLTQDTVARLISKESGGWAAACD